MAVKGKIPAWATRRTPEPADPQAQAGGYGYQGPDMRAPVNAMPTWLKPGQAVQTGDNQRASYFTPQGSLLRMGPNTMYDPNQVQPTYSPLEKFWMLMQGQSIAPEAPSGAGGVRGALPKKNKNLPAWA